MLDLVKYDGEERTADIHVVWTDLSLISEKRLVESTKTANIYLLVIFADWSSNQVDFAA